MLIETSYNHSMKSELLKLTNIGVASVKKLNIIGIFNIEEFFKYDPYDLFELMLEKVNPTLPPPMLSSLVGAHDGVPWYKINETCKAEYKKRHPNHRWCNYRK